MNPVMQQPAPAVCPVCGEKVPHDARACTECGADHNSGWREDAETYDGVDLPESFDYEEFAQREFGTTVPGSSGLKTVWWLTAVLLLVLTVLYFVALR